MTDDHGELDGLMQRFLNAVSFQPGQRPPYDELRVLFGDGARLIKNSGKEPEIETVEEFIAPRRRSVDAGELTAFEETELAAITELFGNVAHRFSTYAKRGTLKDAPIDARGAISTQFIRTQDGWRISSMAWDDERPGVSLPDRYRP